MRLKRGYYDVFVRTCAKYPSSVAVRLYDDGAYKNYTYSELYGVCEYVSQNLQQLKCNKGIIGLVSERNIIIPCIIAAAHKCCTTFMFIDPAMNIETMAENICFTVMITIKNDDGQTPPIMFGKKPDRTVTVFDMVINFYNCSPPDNQEITHLNQHSFIAMTSGSTGEPKHIQVPIQCIQPNIDDLTKMFNIIPEDIIYFSTPLTFDPSMVEILLACMNGASLLIAPDKADILFPQNKAKSITFWQTTPSRFFQYSNADIKNKILSANSPLKVLALGGEPLNGIKRLKELKECDNKTRIFTLYGVTEMSCWACAAELDLARILTDKEIPLGNCLSETAMVVEPSKKNDNTGKIKLVSKTRTCLVLNKTSTKEENTLKMVDTGDLGEIRNGTIYYTGRKDDIIKRFGHKVNLQIIESTIMQCPRVKTCSCVWLPKPLLLLVYFSSESLSSQELTDFLKCKLDEKHWPDKVLRVDNLPTNAHGKISKQLLSRMYDKSLGVSQTVDSLKYHFLQELKVATNRTYTYDQIKDKDFCSIGGTSFLAVTMSNKLSLISPQFGKKILPGLMSPKYSINDLMQMAHSEISLEETAPSSKKRIKRCRSGEGRSIECNTHINKTASPNKVGNALHFITIWSFDTGKCVDASPTLFQTGNNIYVTVGSHSGQIVIMDAISGMLQGMLTIPSRVEAPVACYQDPCIPACGVVGAHDGTVICFALATFRELWRTNIHVMVKSKAVYCNGFLYIAAYDGTLRCFDAMTGDIKYAISVAEQAISADLVLAKNEYILLGTLSGDVGSVHTVTNTIAWKGTLGSPVFACPALYDDDKYVVFAEVAGDIHCMTVEKGIKIWTYQGAKGNVFSSLHIREVDKSKWQMVFGCFDNKVYSLNIKNHQPRLHWTTQLTSPVYCTPCGLNKYILAASNNGKLCILNADDGTILTEHQLPSETFSSPATCGDYIFIGCRDDHIYALKYNPDV